jgi:hypothetical protein
VDAESAPRFCIAPSRTTEKGVEAPGEVLSPPAALRSSGNTPSEKAERSQAATTKTLYRGAQSWRSDGSSQVDGLVLLTRAWIDRSATRGMLSCRPARAARRSEDRPGGSRSSSAPTCRRHARICDRVRSSRDLVTPYHLDGIWLGDARFESDT